MAPRTPPAPLQERSRSRGSPAPPHAAPHSEPRSAGAATAPRPALPLEPPQPTHIANMGSSGSPSLISRNMLLPSTGAGSAEGERRAERAASVSHRIAPRPAAKAAAPRPGPHRPVTATPGLAPTCRAPSPARRRAGRCRGGRGSRRKRRTKKRRAAHTRTPMAARTLLVPSAPAGSLRACAHRPAAPCASGGGGELGRAGSGAQAPLLGAERQGAGRAPPSGRNISPLLWCFLLWCFRRPAVGRSPPVGTETHPELLQTLPRPPCLRFCAPESPVSVFRAGKHFLFGVFSYHTGRAPCWIGCVRLAGKDPGAGREMLLGQE